MSMGTHVMTADFVPDRVIWRDFVGALNAQLAASGCEARIAPDDVGPSCSMLVTDGAGAEIGWLPISADVDVVSAFHALYARLTG